MTSAARWTFKVPTPLGITQSTYEFAADGLHFTSDDRACRPGRATH